MKGTYVYTARAIDFVGNTSPLSPELCAHRPHFANRHSRPVTDLPT